MATARPRCNRVDCFQNRCGRACELLRTYPRQPCPFYQTQEQVEEGRRKAHQKLVNKGRYDLIECYEYNPYRRGMW